MSASLVGSEMCIRDRPPFGALGALEEFGALGALGHCSIASSVVGVGGLQAMHPDGGPRRRSSNQQQRLRRRRWQLQQ
eukprot:408701-Alexandrium_andersonii.AAC.1